MRESHAPLAYAAIFALLCACGEHDTSQRTADSIAQDSQPNVNSVPAGRHRAVQFASFSDSAVAAAMRDSLDRAGWTAYVRGADVRANRVWRVLIAPTARLDIAEAIAFALREHRPSSPPIVVSDSGMRSSPEVIDFVPVNRGTHGMAARTRWALSPDRRSILVVEDPAAVENDALPNGFFFASEEPLRQVQADSVWDVSPSPDWRRAVYGRAYMLRGGEADTLPDAAWQGLASRLGMPVRDVREGGFSVSGMATMWGFARPGVLDLESGRQREFPVAAGWRVRWSADGSRIAAGASPERVNDDATATRWIALDPRDGSPEGEIPDDASFAEVSWTDGPTIDISVPADTSRVALPVEGGGVDSRGGWIRVRGRLIGPGVALAATRGGRYVVALVPDPHAAQYEARDRLAVYVLAGSEF